MAALGAGLRESQIRITYLTKPDKEGKRSFEMEWWSEKGWRGPSWRGQMFYADPLPHIAVRQVGGLQIIEVDKS